MFLLILRLVALKLHYSFWIIKNIQVTYGEKIIMKKKIIIFVLSIIFLILMIVLLINTSKSTNETLIVKTTYNYPYKITIKINNNANIYKSKMMDELTIEGAPKDNFSKVGTISKDDISTIKNIINEMKKETLKNANFSKGYGLAINIGNGQLYECEYFSQENVDKLNAIIEKYN